MENLVPTSRQHQFGNQGTLVRYTNYITCNNKTIEHSFKNQTNKYK